MNGKSSRCVVSKERNCHRLKAVSDYSFCEVRPGVGPVRKKDNIIAGSGITHVTCTERRMRVIELYSLKRVEPRIYFVSYYERRSFFIYDARVVGVQSTEQSVGIIVGGF